MKRFLINIALFGVVMFLLMVAAEIVLLHRPNEYSYKREYIEKNGDRIKTLIIGHSQASYALNPSLMGDSVFNFAIRGRNLYYDKVLLERYLDKLPNLKQIIMPIAYMSAIDHYHYGPVEGADESFRCMYAKYFDIVYPGYSKWWCWSEILHSDENFGERIWLRDSVALRGNDSGYNPFRSRWAGWRNDGMLPPVDFSSPEIRMAIKDNMGYMRQIAVLCRNRGVNLLIYTAPHTKEYCAALPPLARETLQRAVREMQGVYPAIKYRDYTRHSAFTDDDFHDGCHLMPSGATKLSKLIKCDL